MLKVNIQILMGHKWVIRNCNSSSFVVNFCLAFWEIILLEKGLIAWLPFFSLEFESSIMYFIVFNRLIQNLCAIADLIVNKIHNNQIDIYSKSV